MMSYHVHNFLINWYSWATLLNIKEAMASYPKWKQWRSHWGGKGGQSATPDSENLPKIGKKPGKIGKKSGKSGKNQEKSGKKVEKSGRKSKNREVSFTLPLLTDKAGYATEWKWTKVTEFCPSYKLVCNGDQIKIKAMMKIWSWSVEDLIKATECCVYISLHLIKINLLKLYRFVCEVRGGSTYGPNWHRPPPFWPINHANSAYFRLFLGYFQLISATRPPFLHLGPLFTYPGSAPVSSHEYLSMCVPTFIISPSELQVTGIRGKYEHFTGWAIPNVFAQKSRKITNWVGSFQFWVH